MAFYQRPEYNLRHGWANTERDMVKKWLAKKGLTMFDFGSYAQAKRHAIKIKNHYIYYKSKKRLNEDVARIIHGYLDHKEIL